MRTLTKWILATTLMAGAAANFAQQAAAPALPALPALPAPPARPAAAGPENGDAERQLEEARDRLDQAARQVAELSARLGERVRDRVMLRDMVPPRSMLGVQIDNKTGAGGAPVQAVSPGGAADQAGVKAGDLVTAVDGKDLTKEANPARVLVDHVRGLAPEQKVKLRVQRDGKSQEITVTTRPPEPRFAHAGGPAFSTGPGAFNWQFDRGPPGSNRQMPGWGTERQDFAGLELASLTPRLGSYFGAKSGVLVVRSGNSAYQLEDGDVITAIDGREPTSAAHATRILRSYQHGEKVSIKVLRDHKAKTLDVTIAGGGGRPNDGHIAGEQHPA